MAWQKEFNTGDTFTKTDQGLMNLFNEDEAYRGILYHAAPTLDAAIDQENAERNQISDYQKLKDEWEKVEEQFKKTRLQSVWEELQKLKDEALVYYPDYSTTFFLTYEGSLQFVLSQEGYQLITEVFFENDNITEAFTMEFQNKELINSNSFTQDEYQTTDILS